MIIALSQDVFAKKADVSYKPMTKIKTRAMKQSSLFVMVKISKALDIALRWTN